MKAMYSELFRKIVKAYYENNLKEELSEILNDKSVDKNELGSVIASLCGVNINFNENIDIYIEELKKAVLNYSSEHKIVEKVLECGMDCADEDGKTRCQKSCPFDAIGIRDGQSFIINDKCTDCGFCVEGCIEGKILDKVEFVPLVNLLKQETTVIAAVAPAITGQFGENVTINQLRCALKKIGFTDMVEVAFFADMLTLKEANEFSSHVLSKGDFMITSCCCPMWMAMLKKVYNDLIKHVSPSVSPMIAAGRVMKKLNPSCKVVFIGPCIAKKSEAKEKDLIYDIDYVLTFAELKDIFEALFIKPSECNEDISTEYASRGGRLYAKSGGVSIAVSDVVERLYPDKDKYLKPICANGIKECKELLSKAQNGQVSANFLEGMGCIGGCVGGPKALIPTDEGRIKVEEFADSSEIKVAVDSDCMKVILNKIGINSEKDFGDSEKIDIFERKL